MKVDSTIRNHSSLIKYQRPKDNLGNAYFNERSVSKSVERGYNSGSSVSFGSAANFSLKALNKLNTLCADSGVIAASLIALFYAVGLRPAAIMSLPGKKDKDDKIYASGHAIASGIIGFVFSSIVMSPLDAASKKIKEEAEQIQKRIAEAKEKHITIVTKELGEDAKKNGNTITVKDLVKDLKYLNEKFINIFGKTKDGELLKINRKLYEKAIKALEFAPDTFFFGILKAMLTIALIPPILKYVFGVEKKSSKPAQQNQQTQNVPALSSINPPKMQDFMGGLK